MTTLALSLACLFTVNVQIECTAVRAVDRLLAADGASGELEPGSAPSHFNSQSALGDSDTRSLQVSGSSGSAVVLNCSVLGVSTGVLLGKVTDAFGPQTRSPAGDNSTHLIDTLITRVSSEFTHLQ